VNPLKVKSLTAPVTSIKPEPAFKLKFKGCDSLRAPAAIFLWPNVGVPVTFTVGVPVMVSPVGAVDQIVKDATPVSLPVRLMSPVVPNAMVLVLVLLLEKILEVSSKLFRFNVPAVNVVLPETVMLPELAITVTFAELIVSFLIL
jgi:hypothetical protein